MTALLSTSSLVAGYGDTPIINEVDVFVEAGEIVAVVGPNGAGKSTLLKTLAGLVHVRSGSVRFRETEIAGRPTETIVGMGIGYVPQVANVFPSLTVRENLELMIPRRLRKEARRARVDEVLALFPSLVPRLGMRAKVLSGGERQFLALARALVDTPALLLLDEPTAAVAPRAVGMVFDKILEINGAGVSVLLVEQNARKALALADRAYVMERGRIALSGSGRALAEDPDVGRLYLGGALTAAKMEA